VLRDTSIFSPGPATEIIAVFTDNELPHVEQGVVGPDRVRHQLPGLLRHCLGPGRVVETVERQHVRGEHPGADDLDHPWVGATALLVARRG
jgi:hypothetical protein